MSSNINRDGIVVVRIPVSEFRCTRVLFENGSQKPEETMVFKSMTFGDFSAIEKASGIVEIMPDGSMSRVSNPYDMERNTLYRCLVSTSLIDKPILFDDGWMSDESLSAVDSIPAPYVRYAIDMYRKSFSLDDDEEMEISKQSHLLFGGSGSVSNPLPSISRYCLMSTFADKFNMSEKDMGSMSYYEYIRLRKIIDIEIETTKRKMQTKNGGGPTSSASFGGVASRNGIVISDKG